MNTFDKLIGYISPEWGLRRMAARSAITHAPKLLEQSYRGGVSTRVSTGWATQMPYTLQSLTDRARAANMRDRARKADRDNPIANGLLNRDVDNTIGEGMTLQVRSELEDFNKEAEEKFALWAETADIRQRFSFGGLQRQWYRSMRRDGDCGIALVDRAGRSRLQTIAGDMISSPDGKQTETLLDGVEVDRVGRAIAYHILNQTEQGKREWSRINSDDFLFLSRDLFNTQVRGISVFAPVFPLLDQLDGYVDAVVIAARMAAVFGLIFKEQNAAKSFAGLPTLTNSQGESQKAITLENGMLKYIGQSDDVVQVQASQPMSQTPDFIRAIMRLIGLAFDMPLELAMLDVSQANLSSLRGGMHQFYRSCKSRQDQFRGAVLKPVYRWWVSREIKAGSFISAIPQDYLSHEWQARGWQFTDPVADVQAKMLEIDAGFTSPQDVCAELGRDFEAIQDKRKEAQDAYERRDLTPVRSSMSRDVIDTQPQEQNEQTQPIDPDGNSDGDDAESDSE